MEDKRGNTALHTAARHGHASVTKTLVSNGANVLKRGAGGMLPVHMACLSGYSDCVENLIPRGETGVGAYEHMLTYIMCTYNIHVHVTVCASTCTD